LPIFAAALKETGSPELAGLIAGKVLVDVTPDAIIVPGLTVARLNTALENSTRLAMEQFVADNYEAIKAAVPAFSFKRIFGQSVNSCSAAVTTCGN